MTFKEDYAWKCKELEIKRSFEKEVTRLIEFERNLSDAEKYQRLKDIYSEHQKKSNESEFKKEFSYMAQCEKLWFYRLRAKIFNFLL